MIININFVRVLASFSFICIIFAVYKLSIKLTISYHYD